MPFLMTSVLVTPNRVKNRFVDTPVQLVPVIVATGTPEMFSPNPVYGVPQAAGNGWRVELDAAKPPMKARHKARPTSSPAKNLFFMVQAPVTLAFAFRSASTIAPP